MFRIRYRLLLILSIAVGLVLSTYSCGEQKPQTLTIKIVQTSDIHGAIFPYDFVNDRELEGSLARVSTFLKQERKNPEQHVILLDNGDILQGQPVVYYANFIDTVQQHLVSRVYNFLGFNAATMGNHDIEAGPAVYNKLVKESGFPWLAANIVSTAKGKPFFHPYTIINVEGVEIAVLGMITANVPNWLPPKLWEGMEFSQMLPAATLWMKEIENKEKPDIIVGLFHDGFGPENEIPGAEKVLLENASSQVGFHVPGFDLLMVGHDHQLWNKTIQNVRGEDVIVLGPGGHCNYIAVATIQLTWNKQTRMYDKEITGELIELSEFEPDPEFMEIFADDFNSVKEFVNTSVGYMAEEISTRDAMFGPSAFVDFIHKIQLDITKADVSFVAPLSFDATIPAGELFVKDMFRLYRFENYLYTMELTGEEIKKYLEFSYGNWMDKMDSADDFMLLYRYDENGQLVLGRNGRPRLSEPSYNFDAAAGLIYTVDVSKPAGERIIIKSLQNGNPFSAEERYKVAINSYRGSGGGGHLEIGAGIPREEFDNRLIAATTKDFRHFIMKWIKEKGTVEPVVFNNWKVIPEAWWKGAREREMKLLFGNQ